MKLGKKMYVLVIRVVKGGLLPNVKRDKEESVLESITGWPIWRFKTGWQINIPISFSISLD
jgi:hypothetical protein